MQKCDQAAPCIHAGMFTILHIMQISSAAQASEQFSASVAQDVQPQVCKAFPSRQGRRPESAPRRRKDSRRSRRCWAAVMVCCLERVWFSCMRSTEGHITSKQELQSCTDYSHSLSGESGASPQGVYVLECLLEGCCLYRQPLHQCCHHLYSVCLKVSTWQPCHGHAS